MSEIVSGRVDLTRLKPSFATRRIDINQIVALDVHAQNLIPGDVVVAEVRRIGQHQGIERPEGRRAKLFPGDRILVACGSRYAPDQFEANCPTAVGPSQLVAAGGITGLVTYKHSNMADATDITIIGAAVDSNGRRINLADHAIASTATVPALPVVMVCGTSMNAGKTHTVASLVRGLALADVKVAAIKVTGTGAGGDLWFCKDSGAHLVLDFTDAGFATTYRAPIDAIVAGARNLIAAAAEAGAEAAVVEVADGLLQAETAALIAQSCLPRSGRRCHLRGRRCHGAPTAGSTG